MTAHERPAAGIRAELRPHDERCMRLALALGARHLGLTWPNPSVGAVVVDESGAEPVILAQGITQPGGRPHAERVALEAAGERARGATLYVSLEPCSHHGVTPPCIDAVRDFGIARVVTALEDPDTRVSGRGHAILRQAGVTVLCGVLADEATRSHRGHILRVTEGRPSVMLKLARTADGYAARKGGGRLMISGARSNARTHLIRARHDAIMVGIGTVLADDPLLTVRLPGLESRSPVRVVIDSALRTPPVAQIVRTVDQVPTWIVATEAAPVEAERRLVAAGAEVMRVGTKEGRVDVAEALRLLADRGITRVFSEGGPNLAEALIAADRVDELATATSRAALGEEGFPALGPLLSRALAERFVRVANEDLGEDELDIYERSR
ncbi:MAG TPA: bifunctional diaminohydroxyphosphoribosylaminopyrimidine deaminase/5-amino-6-(5-phosphoribosylamino)uracil reductase RibD [Microvirga sp.]|jgi:diaminohydroxyphosphoribosylaminopyrimidine deaminase/5-amino-6-(5-phosphoribosylamino)uracil reductase|nr:bifunctional diaminohydroxyphosphoribosylaminopyrimidine deaminase/5-amino-6-(5-phosphoribosylamino)uracil reductase RibD [Microvirga sp.]